MTDGTQSIETPQSTPLVEIIIKEDLTAQATARLQALLSDALAMGPTQLIVDLAECSYADARAVDVLLSAHRRAWHTGGRLTLRAPSARVRWLLELAHVDHVFNITPAHLPDPPSMPVARSTRSAGEVHDER